jgi:hypothetical protein
MGSWWTRSTIMAFKYGIIGFHEQKLSLLVASPDAEL